MLKDLTNKKIAIPIRINLFLNHWLKIPLSNWLLSKSIEPHLRVATFGTVSAGEILKELVIKHLEGSMHPDFYVELTNLIQGTLEELKMEEIQHQKDYNIAVRGFNKKLEEVAKEWK